MTVVNVIWVDILAAGIQSDVADTMVSITHELVETITDRSSGWRDNTIALGEIADFCVTDNSGHGALYSDGLRVSSYLDSTTNNCVAPGATNTPTSTGHTNHVLDQGSGSMSDNILWLIFWGPYTSTNSASVKSYI